MKKCCIEKAVGGYNVVLHLKYAYVQLVTHTTKKAATEWAKQNGYRITKSSTPA